MAKRNRNNIVQKKSLVKDIAAKLEKEQKEAKAAANETAAAAEAEADEAVENVAKEAEAGWRSHAAAVSVG